MCTCRAVKMQNSWFRQGNMKSNIRQESHGMGKRIRLAQTPGQLRRSVLPPSRMVSAYRLSCAETDRAEDQNNE